jgi:hypothetical protein
MMKNKKAISRILIIVSILGIIGITIRIGIILGM